MLNLQLNEGSAILGALNYIADVGDGATGEQVLVIETLSRSVLDLPADTISIPIDEIAEAFVTAASRRRCMQLAMIVGVCRHPLGGEQLNRLAELGETLGVGAEEINILSELSVKSAELVTGDFVRSYDSHMADMSEVGAGDADELAEMMKHFRSLAPGTLGYSYVAFHDRNGFQLPGSGTPNPAYYVNHDMNHVIAGYEPTGPGEIALGAFKVGMSDTDATWMAFLANLLIHEVGLFKHGKDEQFIPYGTSMYADSEGQGALHLPGAAALVAEGFARGAATTYDFASADHLALADQLLVDLRSEFGVRGRADAYDGGLGVSWS